VKSKSLDVDPEPEAYLLYWQKAVVESTRGMSVVVRTTAPILDPAWSVSRLNLEDLVLAYMSGPAASRSALPLEVVP